MRKKTKMIKKLMQKKIINKSDNAVVGIIAAFLILGLIVAVFSVIQLQYVPKWMKEKEAAHMEEVSNQFTQLKYALDVQSLVNDGTSVTTSVKLGTGEMPFFNSVRTFGSLQIDDNTFDMTIERWNDTTPINIFADSIKYSSGNLYFANQQYIYEAGALILSQDGSDVLYGRPSLFVEGYGNRSTISLVIINFSGISGKTSISGYGTYPIYTQVTKFHPYYNGYIDLYNVTNITINTKYTNSWNKTIASAFLFHFDESHYDITEYENDRIEIQFIDSNNDYYHLRYRIVDVSIQISSGMAQ
jgi:hypothetical protein